MEAIMVPRKEKEEGSRFHEKISSAIDFASDVIDCIIEGDEEDINGKLETSIQVETNAGTSHGKRFLNKLESVINGNASNGALLENPSSCSFASHGLVITSPHLTSVGGSEAIPTNNAHIPFNGLFAASGTPSDSLTAGFSGLFASDSPRGGFIGLFAPSDTPSDSLTAGTKTQYPTTKDSVSQPDNTISEEDLETKPKKAVDFQTILTNFIRHQDEKTAKNEISDEEEYKLLKLLRDGAKEFININRLQESEEEEIELEFERAVENLDQHRVHCPNCNSSITKVVLRKRRRANPVPSPPWKDCLLGCLSCFSIFIPPGGCFDLFRIFRKGPQPKVENRNPVIDQEGASPNPDEASPDEIHQGREPDVAPRKPDTRIDISPVSETDIGSKKVEILKSIVYGGLMESITSLSVVSSAAAADATTANIVAMGLANLIGGLFVLGPNLRELKNDDSGQADRYKELLGQRENFLLHATVVVLSFLVFGLIPPVTYGFSFRQSNDMDLKLLAVAAASLLCIAILAIGKAYIQRQPNFLTYIKTVLYYVCMAVMGSGISYAVGDLIQRLVKQLGWFDSSAAVALPLLEVGSINPAWGSY